MDKTIELIKKTRAETFKLLIDYQKRKKQVHNCEQELERLKGWRDACNYFLQELNH